MRTVIFILFLVFQFGTNNSVFTQVVILNDPGKTYTNTDGPTEDVYSVDISNCSKIGFSMDFGFSLPWVGDGNMESADECAMLIGCWDFLDVSFFIDGNQFYNDIIGDVNSDPQSGTLNFESPCLDAGSTGSLLVRTQTWAADESVTFSNISIVCWEKETPVIFTTQNICAGDPLTLLEFGAANPISWNWSGPAGNFSGNPWIILNTNPSLSGIYSVTVTDAFGCQSSTSTSISVGGFYSEIALNGNDLLCSFECTQLKIATDVPGTFNYTFRFGSQTETDVFTNEQIIHVCYNGNGQNLEYDDGSNTIHVPLSYNTGELEIELLSIQETNGMICNGTILNDLIEIQYSVTPDISPFDPILSCVQYILPQIDIIGGTGNEKYYTQLNGQGDEYLPGQIITESQTLYAFDNNNGCFDQEIFEITIVPSIEDFQFENLGDIVISEGKCEVVRIGTNYNLGLPYPFIVGINNQSISGTIERQYENLILCLNEDSFNLQYDDDTKTINIPESWIGDNIEVEISIEPCMNDNDFEPIEFFLLPEESAPIPSMGFWSLLILGMMIVIVGAVKSKNNVIPSDHT